MVKALWLASAMSLAATAWGQQPSTTVTVPSTVSPAPNPTATPDTTVPATPVTPGVPDATTSTTTTTSTSSATGAAPQPASSNMTAMATAPEHYPPCSATVHDECVQGDGHSMMQHRRRHKPH